MDVSEYFKSLSLELTGLKNRVRNCIEGGHWLTDGEWKESVLRNVLKRHLPDNIKVGRGFVLKGRAHSRQIDVLLYDASKPVIFKDGDLVFITYDAVKGIIEVKATLNKNNFSRTIKKLSKTLEFISDINNNKNIFAGLFAYDSNLNSNDADWVLTRINRYAGRDEKRIINHISIGNSFFVRYWKKSPYYDNDKYNTWHSYNLKDKSYGYFIHNIVYMFSKDSVRLNKDVWFPEQGKERDKTGEIEFENNNNLHDK